MLNRAFKAIREVYMGNTQDPLIVIGLVVVAALVLTLVAGLISKVVLAFIKGSLEVRITAQYRPDDILMQDLKANYFGRESAGVGQLRGNGGLLLTAKQLHFFMFLPKSDISIPLTAITKLTITKSHLGKATLYDLLKVTFLANGQPDSIAWYLTEPTVWKNRIEALQTSNSTR
jgi:hypothetical protein